MATSDGSVPVTTTDSEAGLSGADSSGSVVSFLDRLKSPIHTEITRKQKLKTNRPPIGKCQCKGTVVSDPKSVESRKRIREFTNEMLKVSVGTLDCEACREELGLKKSTIQNHVRSQKHADSKKKLEMKEAHKQDIALALMKYNEKELLHGETLPEEQQVYRIKVVTVFLRAGIPLSKLDSFRDILEENAYRLTDQRHMFDLISFVLKEQKVRVHKEMTGKYPTGISDGTSHLGEALAVILVKSEHWSSVWFACRCCPSQCQEEIARELISIQLVTYSVQSELPLAAMRDPASVNNLAMQTVRVIYPSLVDIGCFSHTLNHVSENFKMPVLTDFMYSWITFFSHSPKTRLLWKSQVAHSMTTYCATRWWSQWEVVKMVMSYFGNIEPFLCRNDDTGPTLRPKLLPFSADQQKPGLLQLEIAATVDLGEPFVKACYFLEGDGPLAFECYEAIERVSASLCVGNTPNVHAIAQRLSGEQLSDMPTHTQKLVTYAKSCIQPGLDYSERQVGSSLKASLAAFKCARLFEPQKIYTMQPQ